MMAASVGLYTARLAARAGGLMRAPGKPSTVIAVARRTAVTTSSGAIHPKPEKRPKGVDDGFHIDLTSSDSDIGNAPVRSRVGRAKKPVTYLEDSDDEMQ